MLPTQYSMRLLKFGSDGVLHAYVAGSPLNATDPSGEDLCSSVDAAALYASDLTTDPSLYEMLVNNGELPGPNDPGWYPGIAHDRGGWTPSLNAFSAAQQAARGGAGGSQDIGLSACYGVCLAVGIVTGSNGQSAPYGGLGIGSPGFSMTDQWGHQATPGNGLSGAASCAAGFAVATVSDSGEVEVGEGTFAEPGCSAQFSYTFGQGG